MMSLGWFSGDNERVGYSPYRKFNAKPSDYVLVGVAMIVSVGLLVWAFFG